MDIKGVLSETSEKISFQIESGFTAFGERIADRNCSAYDVEDYVVQWYRPRKKPPCPGAKKAGPPMPPKVWAYYTHDMMRLPTSEEASELSSALPKGDHYDASRTTLTYVVIRSSRASGWTPWLIPLNESIGLALPEKVVLGDPEGLAVWELTTEPMLRAEGRAMGHCVGSRSAGYVSKALSGACRILSLRDSREHGIATLEVSASGSLIQCQGKSGIGYRDLSHEQARLVDEVRDGRLAVR